MEGHLKGCLSTFLIPLLVPSWFKSHLLNPTWIAGLRPVLPAEIFFIPKTTFVAHTRTESSIFLFDFFAMVLFFKGAREGYAVKSKDLNQQETSNSTDNLWDEMWKCLY